MAIERERKFLVKHLPYELIEENIKLEEIIQMYIFADDEKQLRIRLLPSKKEALITYKEHITETDRNEYEYYLDYDKAFAIYAINDYECLVEKKRIKYDGWDIDIYPNGIIVAEYEYFNKVDFPEIPSWIGNEITSESKYSNIVIAQNWENFINRKGIYKIEN